MAQQQVELRKVRDFSENLNDTFLFLKQNLKPLLTYVLMIAGLFMLTAAILGGLYQSDNDNLVEMILTGRVKNNRADPMDMFGMLYFAVILFAWLTGTALQVVVVGYMKAYEEAGNMPPKFEEVWQLFKKHFLLVALYQLPLAILLMIGFVLCFIPGIYLAVVFAPFVSIIVVENASFGEAFNRCFTLIKENFWNSLGVYFIIFLISWFSSGIISFIVGLITGLISYFTTEDFKTTVAIVTSVLNVLGFVFYVILFVSVNLNYYNLVERYDGTGMLQRLQTLGTDNPATSAHRNQEEEEY